MLPGIIDQLLGNANVGKKELKAIAVSSGPGSYTGLRIGASTAKALAFGLNLPLISIPTLEILMEQGMEMGGSYDLVVPMLDARRMEVYMMIADMNRKVISPVEAVIVDEKTFVEYQDQSILLLGDGAGKCKGLFQDQSIEIRADLVPEAVHMGTMAWAKYNNQAFTELRYFEPEYLKAFQTKKAKSRLPIEE